MQQTILIVGATSGLGKRLCELYCLEGHIVGGVGRRAELLEKMKKLHPKQFFAFEMDITAPECFNHFRSIINELNGIDLLIITASVFDDNQDFSFSIEQKIIDTNIYGFAAAINAGYHYFLQKGSGQIAGVTSVAAARGNKSTPGYNASKAFQSSYLESVRLKLSGNKKIYITELIPGYIDTDMARGDRIFWMADLNKAANQVKKAIARKKNRAFITKRWKLVYMVYKFLPHSLYSFLINSNLKFKNRD